MARLVHLSLTRPPECALQSLEGLSCTSIPPIAPGPATVPAGLAPPSKGPSSCVSSSGPWGAASDAFGYFKGSNPWVRKLRQIFGAVSWTAPKSRHVHGLSKSAHPNRVAQCRGRCLAASIQAAPHGLGLADLRVLHPEWARRSPFGGPPTLTEAGLFAGGWASIRSRRKSRAWQA